MLLDNKRTQHQMLKMSCGSMLNSNSSLFLRFTKSAWIFRITSPSSVTGALTQMWSALVAYSALLDLESIWYSVFFNSSPFHLLLDFSHGLWCHSACMLQFYYQCVEQNNNSSKKRKTSKNHSNNFTANELMSILNSTLNDKVFAANFPSIGSYLVNRKNE